MNRRINKLLKLGVFGVVAVGTMYAAPTWAAGCVINGSHTYQVGQGTPLIVLGTEPEGTILRTNEGAATPGQWQLTCTPGNARYYTNYESGAVGDVFPLQAEGQGAGENAGIGIRLRLKDSRHPVFTQIPIDETVAYTEPYTIVRESDAFQYELVRLSGPVVYGRIKIGRVGYSAVTNAAGQMQIFRTVSINDITITRPTCSISADTLNQQVDLGTYALGQIPNPNDTTRWINFKLATEKCDSPDNMFANITFGTAADADAINKNLFAINSGGATGVGIELATDKDSAIVPGQLYSFPAVATGENFNFKARLKRTTSAASAGKVLKPVVVQVDFR